MEIDGSEQQCTRIFALESNLGEVFCGVAKVPKAMLAQRAIEPNRKITGSNCKSSAGQLLAAFQRGPVMAHHRAESVAICSDKVARIEDQGS